MGAEYTEKRIRSMGFERVYFLPPPDGGKFRMPEYPWATAIMLLVYAYVPFDMRTGLPGYYIASNTGYHLANELCGLLRLEGYHAQRVEPHIKAILSSNGVGIRLRNSLIALPGLGTRTALYVIATDCAMPRAYPLADIDECGSCRRCISACPFDAISAEGFDPNLCARTYMESADMPEHISERLPGLLGCEICQAVCPRNGHIGTREPTREEERAFDLSRLAKGEIGEARALVGKNMCTKGRLQAQAKALINSRGI